MVGIMRMMTAVVIVLNIIMLKEWTEVMCWRGKTVETIQEQILEIEFTFGQRWFYGNPTNASWWSQVPNVPLWRSFSSQTL